jgi:phosphopantetheine--protein transferase-like protein
MNPIFGLAFGIDAVDISRFKYWHTYSAIRLRRVFSQEEIDYCLNIPAKSAERFAIRFAVKEALYKALSLRDSVSVPAFLKLAAHTQVTALEGHPHVTVTWSALGLPQLRVSATLTHTRTTAIALVFLS